MPQIPRSNPKKTKRQGSSNLKTSFDECLSYLPKALVRKISSLDRILFKNIEGLVSNLSEDVQENKCLVKRALKRQEEIVNELKR